MIEPLEYTEAEMDGCADCFAMLWREARAESRCPLCLSYCRWSGFAPLGHVNIRSAGLPNCGGWFLPNIVAAMRRSRPPLLVIPADGGCEKHGGCTR